MIDSMRESANDRLTTKESMKRIAYTPEQLSEAWRLDLLADARSNREQAEIGPFYPDRGITREALLSWAEENERQAGLPIPRQFAFNSQTNQP